MTHRRTFLAAAGAVGLQSLAGPSFGQAYPSRTITLVVPYAAGGNADLTARMFADALRRTTGQAVIVENRAGGGGSIGAMYVLGAKPDGYTLLFSVPGVFSVTPHLVKTQYGMSDIKPVAFISKTDLLLVARKGGKYKTLSQVIDAARANPGSVSVGYGGIGTPNHLALLNLETAAKVKMTGVPYKGSAPMLQDLLGGQVDVGTDQMSTSKPYLESGTLVPLGVFGAGIAGMPSVPLISSLGAEPYDVTTYLGLAAPKGTPDAVVAALQAVTRTALEDTSLQVALAKVGADVHYGSGKDYEQSMHREDEFIRKMMDTGQLKVE